MTHRRNPLSRVARSISRKDARRDARYSGSPSRFTTDTSRKLQLQTLERRELLAAEIISGPRLVSVEAGAVSQLRLDGTSVENRLDSAPRELTFRFDGTSQLDGNTLRGIRIIGSGGDGTFGDGNEILIQPGFLGFADDEVGDRVVVSRFVQALPDDRYRIQIAGYDDVSNNDVFANGNLVDTNITALRDTDGKPILPADQVNSATPSLNIDFEVEVGARVVAVVPQPITGTAGNRVQARNEIRVYFNQDPLSNPNAGVITNNPNPPVGQTLSGLPVVRPEFYQLFLTKDTVTNRDDLRLRPQTVIYDPSQSMAILKFAGDLSTLTGRTDGVGTFRLRVGSGDSLPAEPTVFNLAAEGATVLDASGNPISVPSNATFNNSGIFVSDANAGQSPEKTISFSPSSGLQSVLLRGGSIENTGAYVPPWPGAYDAPGSRDQRRDASVVGRIDTNSGIDIFPYNFATLYGEDPNGNPLNNAITTEQQQRTREILDLYERHLGVRFVETKDSGLQIVTGDLRGIQETADSGAGKGTPYSLYRVNERDPSRGILILAANEGWYDGYGLSPDARPSWFVEGLRGVGNLLGIGDLFELPDGVAAGGSSPDEPNSETQSNDGNGNNLPAGVAGFPTLSSEPDFLSQSDITLGQSLHRPESSDVDFYSFTIDPPIDENIPDNAVLGRLSLETFAQRLDDVSLLDSLVQLYRVTPGPGSTSNYELIARNDDSYGDDSYLQVDLSAGNYVVGVSSKGNDAYDGDQAGTGNGGRSEGNYELRMTFDSSIGVASGDALVDANGTRLDGDADGEGGGDFNFWFRTAPATADPNAVRTIFVTKDSDGSDSNNGSLTSPYGTVSKALAVAKPGDIVRLLPSAGLDGKVTAIDDPNTTVNEAFNAQKDNRAFEFGRGGTNNSELPDGATFDVPRGVTVMIDAGALLKLRDAKIGVGSDSIDPNRELAAIQVLGTPTSSVVFTSYNDQAVGIDSNPINTTPGSGDWAGIDLRNDVDYAEGRKVWERLGIFLDYVSHADLRYGGGQAGLRGDVVAPIQMSESRPTLIYNKISFGAGAAMSADPNSFREDNFNTSLYQGGGLFTSDYDRVGPKISGNVLTDNTTNGLFVRVSTPAGSVLQTLTQSARFDDTDIVHVISQALTITGAPGGPTLLETRPSMGSVTLTPSTTGNLAAGQHEYVLSFVTREGHESLVSLPTSSVTVSDPDGKGSVTLRNLPTAPEQYIGRKLYRGTLVAGVIQYQLVDQLDRRTDTFVDSGQFQQGTPNIQAVPEATGIAVVVLNGQGNFSENQSLDYRITFADAYGGETRASNATTTVVTGQDASVGLTGIPLTPDGFVGTNVYRRNPSSGDYFLVAELRLGETSLLDDGRDQSIDGSLLGRKLGANADNGSKLLARFDARLTIDPGTIIKLGKARIEATFGADFYAEGTEGKPIVFTSQSDDEYGVGGTFDTNNDGASRGTAGDWGGIELRQDVIASLDHVDVRYGGGEAPVQGGFTKFNALEILQADVRVVNSSFVSNADGKDIDGIGADSGPLSTRIGRGFNDASTIFVRGAQPILIGNTIVGGQGAAISINPDALTFQAVTDPGRSTGMIDRFVDRPDNQGPLLLDNVLSGNALNGMRVRSEIVTTDSVWDDTDIVHVVEGSIYSLTQHYYGAIRLRSDADQSLVVKFGTGASLVGGGRPLDIDDRIGGTLQVIGSPGFPVVLTSINDSTIGAGFTPDGRSQRDTKNTGLPVDASGTEIVTAAAGDWQGLQLRSYINDRNVAYVYENERGDAGAITTNRDPVNAQILGALATGETTGDDNERLGFTIRGTLATQDDIDTYRFSAAGGTAVYFDIDETSPGLDTVVELVNDSGVVIASSDNSLAEANGKQAIYVNTGLQNGVLPRDVRSLPTGLTSGNVESANVLDAGFRVVLPGNFNTKNQYYVRVHSANAGTSGQYELGIRLRGTDEVAGSTVRGADIRFATNAIAVSGAPMHSPLVADVGESVVYVDPTPGDQNSGDETTRETVNKRLSAELADAQNLGNLLTSDRGSLTVTGVLGNLSDTALDVRLEDVDIYRVDLRAQQLKPDTFDSENRFVTTTFDIDYADQLARANTVLSVYDSAGRLILVGRDSNVTDDQGRPLAGIDMSNLTGGSAGTLDAYIGPVELPEGVYYVAVSSEAAVPAVLNQYFEANPVNPNVRLMPVNSVRRISRDGFNESSFFGSRTDDYTAERPVIEPAFGRDSAVDYTLEDIRLFVNLNGGKGSNNSTLVSVNPFTGTVYGGIGGDGPRSGDIAIRRDGELFNYSLPPNNPNNGNTGNFLNVSPANGAANSAGDDSIEFRQNNEAGTGLEVDGNAQFIVNAMTFSRNASGAQNGSVNNRAIDNASERFWVVGSRDSGGRNGVPIELRTNIIYQSAAGNGEITSRGSLDGNADRNFGNGPYRTSLGPAAEEVEFGIVDTGFIDAATGGDGGSITGLAALNNNLNDDLVAVTNLGGIHVFDPRSTQPAPLGFFAQGYNRVIPTVKYGHLTVDPDHLASPNTQLGIDPDTGERFPRFTGLSLGPQVVEGGKYADILFATTVDGWMYAFTLDTDNAGLPTTKPANIFYNGHSAVQLRTLGSSAGSGFGISLQTNGLAFSNLEVNPWHTTTDRRDDNGHGDVVPYDRSRLNTNGGTSLYFGFEVDDNENNNTIGRPEGSNLGQMSPGGSHGSAISESIDLSEYSPADKPTLYFSYNINVEGDDDYRLNRAQHDSFRVFAAGDDGQWKLLATNDAFRQLASSDEYDEYAKTGIAVQTVFDDNPIDQWRQVRVDLSPLAGSRDARIRFDFSTAGAMRTQFGSVELVGVDGEKLSDNDITLIRNDNGRISSLQTIVGRDVVLPAGANLANGDSFTVTYLDPATSPQERTATVKFVTALTPGATGIEVLINPTATAVQVASDVAAAVPGPMRPRVDDNGRLSLLAATNIQIDGKLIGGEANPIEFQGDFRQLLVPNGDDAAIGERVTISFPAAPTVILRYVRAVDAADVSGDVQIVALSGETRAQIANRIVAELPVGSAFVDTDGNLIFVQLGVTFDVEAADSLFVITDLDQATVRTRIDVPAGNQLVDDELLVFRYGPNGVNRFAVAFDDGDGLPANIFAGYTTNATLSYTASTTRAALATALAAAITANAPDLDPLRDDPTSPNTIRVLLGDRNNDRLPDVTTAATSNILTSLEPVTLIDVPAGADLRNGDRIQLFSGGQFVTLIFAREGTDVSPNNNVRVYFTEDLTAAEVSARIVDKLQTVVPELGAVPSRTSDGFGLGRFNSFASVPTIQPTITQQDDLAIDTYGVPVTLPGGSKLTPDESITIFRKDAPLSSVGTTYTFRTVATAAPNEVIYAITDTPQQVAQKFLAALNPNLVGQMIGTSGREVIIIEAGSVSVQRNDSKIVSWEAKRQSGFQYVPRAVPVITNVVMDSNEVAQQLQRALVSSIGIISAQNSGFRTTASAEHYRITGGDRIRLYLPDTGVSPVLDSGPYGLNSILPGDRFGLGAPNSVTVDQGADGADNVGAGVYIDDIIIGMAERGEAVLYENYTAEPGNSTYVVDPSYLPDTRRDAVQPEHADEILVGGYSLQIRTSDEYGVPQDYDPRNLILDEQSSSGRSFDSNDRLVDGAVTIVAPAGRNLLDGDTFVLDDGSHRLTFEFDSRYARGVMPDSGHVPVPFDPADTEAQVAASIRDAINSSQAQDTIAIRAATGDSSESGTSTSSRVELFGNAFVLNDNLQRRPVATDITVNPGSQRTLKLDLGAEETFKGRYTSKRIAVIDQDSANTNTATNYVLYSDELAQAAVPGYVSGDTLFAIGKIGDAVNIGISPGTSADDGAVLFSDPTYDMDTVRVYLEAGKGIDIDLDTTGLFKVGAGLVRPFVAIVEQGTKFTSTELNFAFAEDINGNPAISEFNSPTLALGETQEGATLQFTPIRSGYYDVIVSSAAVYTNGGFPANTTDLQLGDYALTIRPTGDPGVPARDVLMVDYQFGISDQNRVSDQGQMIIADNFIRDSANVGISTIVAAESGRFGSASSVPGSAALLRNVNQFGLIPGAVIVNNVIERSGNIAIQIGGGDYSNGEQGTPSVFSRVVNNTIVNEGGTGISVTGRAAPTLLNNVIVGANTGISVNTQTASGTRTGSNLFANNTVNSTLPIANSSINLGINVDLARIFQDASRSIYIPAAGSLLIDNSIDALDDRSDFAGTVKGPMGLPPSPILAPAVDIYGQRRVDGISGTPGGGTGSNVFVDRGAVDRADFRRPNAVLNNPFDAPNLDAAGSPTDPNTVGDTDPEQSFVRLVNSGQFVKFFEIQLIDEAGTGLDASTITADTVLLTENGRQLLPGRDFTFGYSENSRTIRLTPLAGVWNQDSVYEVTLNNQVRRVVELPSGGSIADGDQVVVTDNSGRESVFEFDSGYTLGVPQNKTLVVTDTRTAFRDTDTFTIKSADGSQSVTFEINTVGTVASANVAIPLAGTGTVTEVRDAILRVLDPTLFAGSPSNAVNYAVMLGLAPMAVGNDGIQLGTLPGHVVNTGNISAGLIQTGDIDSMVDGQRFSYTRAAQTVTFEFDSNGSFDPADQTQTLRRIAFSRTDTANQIAAAIATSLRNSNIDLSDAIAIGDGLVSVGGREGDTVAFGDSNLSLTGNPGVTGGLSITVPATQTGASMEGSTVTVNVDGVSETFLFTTNPQLTSPNVTVVVAADANATSIAAALQSAIEANLGSTLQNVTRTGAVITIGETAAEFTTINVVDGAAVVGPDALLVDGVSGGAFAVDYTPSDAFPAVSVATKLQQAIDDAGVNADVFSPGGGVLLFAGTQNVVSRSGVNDAGRVAPTIAAVSDLAGNPVSPTRPNNETRFTIIMPDVRFDFGDAPQSYGTLLQSPTPNLQPTDPNYIPGNGARHAITGGSGGSRLGMYVDTEPDGQPVDTGVGVSDDQLQSVGAAATAAILVTPNLARITITKVPRSGDLLTVSVGSSNYEFQFISDGTTAVAPRVTIPIAAGDRASDVAATLLAAINAKITTPGVTASITAAHPEQIEIKSLAVGATPAPVLMVGSDSSLFSPAFAVDDSNPNSLAIKFSAVPSAGQLIDLRTDNQTRTYEFVDAGSNPRPGSVPVLITTSSTTAQVAAALLAAIRPNLSALGGSILANIDSASPSTVRLTAIDDEDGVSVVTFNQGGATPPAYFFGRYADNGAVFDQSQADQVFGFLNPKDPAGTNVEIYVTGGGLVDAWIDFNGNGVFDEDGSEQVLKNTPVVDGINTLNIVTPNTVTDKDTWLRVRLSDSGNTRPTGVAIGGEVEDYRVSVRSVPLPVPSGAGDDFIAIEDTPLRIDSTLSASNPPLPINQKTLFTNDNFASQILPVRYFVDLPRIFVEPDQTSFPGDDVLVYRTPAGGTIEVNRTMNGATPGDDLTGSFLYTPPKDFNGVDTFRYRLSTQQNADSSNLDGITFETVTINVLPDNDDPGASDETFVTFEPTRDGGNATLIITASDLIAAAIPDYSPNQSTAPLDESNQTILVRSIATASGSITAGGSGSTIITLRGATLVAEFNDAVNPQWITRLLYTPAADFNSDIGAVGDLLLDEFTFTLFDNGISELPADLQTNLADLVTDGQLGAGDLSVAPYYISGGERNQFLRKPVTASEATATATIRVVPRNDAPVPVTDYVGLTDATGAPNTRYLNFFSNPATRPTPTEDTALVFPAAYLLGNDSAGPVGALDETDPLIGNDGDIRVVAVGLDDANANTLSRGSISLNPATGMITFTPADDVYGEITFTYTVMDSGIDEGLDIDNVFDPADRGTRVVNGQSTTITSTIFVAPVNDAPVAYDRLVRMTESANNVPTSITIDAGDLITANIPAALGVDSNIIVTNDRVTLPDADELFNGETLIFTAANGRRAAIALNTTGIAPAGVDRVVRYSPNDVAADLATRLQQALRATGFGGTAAGNQVTFSDVTTVSLEAATSGIQVDGTNILVPAGSELVDGERIRVADASGNATIVEFNTSGVPSIGADVAVAFTVSSTASEVAIALQEQLRSVGLGAIADVGAFGVPAGFTRVSLQVINQASLGELPDAPGDFDSRLPAPFNESEQTPGLRIIEVSVAGATLNLQTNTSLVSANPALIGTLEPLGLNEAGLVSDAGGIFRFEIASEVVNGQTLRYFSNIHYTPPLNYNEQLPFAPSELLKYKIIDDGKTTVPSPASVRNLPPRVSESGTLTITVAAANDVPTFNGQLTVNVLERDDRSSTTIPNFVSQIFAGPDDAFDEVQNQQVDFLAPEWVSGDPSVMDSPPVINYTPGATQGSLTVFPAPDQIGQVVYKIVAYQIDDPASLSDPQFVTINVRPVNDRPRIDPTIAGSSDSANPDEGYSVTAGKDTDGDGFSDQATIRYTLREDNTRPNPAQPGQVLTGGYFIPVDKNITLPSDIAGTVIVGDYTRLGLLDVYNVGPANEAVNGTAEVPTGGKQVLELFDFPDKTKLGGTLVRKYSTTQVDANGNPVLIGVLYTPPTDFNNFNGAVDSFEYTVRDDNPGDGETYSLETNSLVQNRLTSTSVVQLNLIPVNDRPEFSTLDLAYEVAEDAPEQVVNGFAFGISAGPAQSAFDEINSGQGQKLNFTVSSLSFNQADAAQFFDELPTVDLQGQLRYKLAKDVYGTFEFDVTLNDDGSSDSTRGDLNSSIPARLTISGRPVNDRPVVAPQFNTPATNPLRFELSEGGSQNVLVNGDGTSPGLLDVFLVGPANEAANIVPGGNQSVSLTQPIPITTAQGGRLELITPTTGSPYFRYTPRANYVGPDNFNYTVTDDGVTVPVGAGGVAKSDPQIATGTVTFNVLPVNDAPQFSGAGDVTSEEDANSGSGRGVVTIANWATNVQAGPPGADDENGPLGQGLQFEILPLSGNFDLFTVAPTAVVNSGGTASLNYTLAPNANGSATFTVQLFDDGPDNLGNGDINESDIRTFTINVNPVNDAPAFVPGGTVTVFEDRGPYSSTWATSISPGPPDEASQGVSFTVAPVAPSDAALFTANGQPQISSTGVLTFTPAANANGTARVRVIAIDSEGAQSAAVNLDIVVTPVNDFPYPVGDQLDPTTEDTILTIPAARLLANDVDPDLNDAIPDVLQLSMPLVQRSLRGAIVRFDPITGIVTYDPTQSRELQALRPDSPVLADSFSYAVTDKAGRSVTPNRVSNSVLVTVNVSGVNDAPTVRPDTPTLNASGPTTIDVLANDEDIDGTIVPSTLKITSQPAFGSLTVNPNTGAIVYTPFTGFLGQDEFRYTVEDDLGAISQEGRVEISPNVAPIVRDDNGVAYVGESVILRVLDNDVDSDSADNFDLTSVQIESGPAAGSVTTLPDGTVRYTPIGGFTGRDSFEYSVADTRGRRSGIATVSIQVVASRLQNPDVRYDVNDDGAVSALDALLIINFLNRYSDAVAAGATIPSAENLTVEISDPVPPDTYLSSDGNNYGAAYFDVSGNRVISELDVLQVINELNRRDTSGGVGEPLLASGSATSSFATASAALNTSPVTPQTASSGAVPVDLPSTPNPLAKLAATELFDVFDSEDKWVDTSAAATIDTDVLDRLVAAQQDDDEWEEDSDLSAAIDAAMSRLL